MPSYLGLTWDHPRGKDALRAAAERLRSTHSGLEIHWDVHPLEGFESDPIGDIAERYDLIVLDHPHLGEAIAQDALIPLDEVVEKARLSDWSRRSVGQSFASYTMFDQQWALPLDAATQVSVYKPALIDSAPRTWDEVEALSRVAPVALSLAGPHALLTLISLCSALEGAPVASASRLAGSQALPHAIELMRSIAANSPPLAAAQNPIAMLERMRDSDEIAYCPLIFGYVNYASDSLRFVDVPAAHCGAPQPGSVLGGTGLALSRRCQISPELVDHISWLMSDEAQQGFIPEHQGQPSARGAWLDARVNERAAGFYTGTLATIEASLVRPRDPGYIVFQGAASAVVRDVVLDRSSPTEGIETVRNLAQALRQPVGGAG